MGNSAEIKKLDEILKFIVDHPAAVRFGEIKIAFPYPNNKEVDEILHKLEKDGFITPIGRYIDQLSQNVPIYLSTFDGRLFLNSGGYRANVLKSNSNQKLTESELSRHQMLDSNLEANTSRLNTLTLWLTIGTIVLALMEIIKFVIFCLSSQNLRE